MRARDADLHYREVLSAAVPQDERRCRGCRWWDITTGTQGVLSDNQFSNPEGLDWKPNRATARAGLCRAGGAHEWIRTDPEDWCRQWEPGDASA